VPASLSVWELSVEKNIATKTDGDYGKEPARPTAHPPRGNGRWKDVHGRRDRHPGVARVRSCHTLLDFRTAPPRAAGTEPLSRAGVTGHGR
jgi:hypothetical protein